MPLHTILLFLRITVAFQCVGAAWVIFQYGTSINTLLYIYRDYSESTTGLIDQISEWMLLVVAVGILVRPSWWFAVPISVWALVDSLALWSNDAYMYSWLAPMAHAVRYIAPMALVILVGGFSKWREPAIWALRISIGATFAAHGLEALWHYHIFIDYTIGAGYQLLGLDISEHQATTALTVIGIIDLVLAALIVTRRWRWVAGYMACWGLLTATIRIVNFGWSAWFELSIRMAHVGIPLALMYYWHMKMKSRGLNLRSRD